MALDTHRIVQRLRASGFDERQAETVTDVLIETRSTELGELVTKADFAEFRAEFKAEIARLDNRITPLEQRIDARFESLEQRMTIKLGLMLVAGIAAVATLVKLL